MTVGERFAAIRAQLGLNQTQMAEKAGVQRDSWRRYEAGALPNGETLERIAGMGFSLDWVLLGIGQMLLIEGKQTKADTEESQLLARIREAMGNRAEGQPIPGQFQEALEAAAVALKWGPDGYRVAAVVLSQLVRMIEDEAKR